MTKSVEGTESEREAQSSPQPPAPPSNLAAKTTHGIALLVMNTGLQKVLSLVSQLVLAWLLSPDDFGLVALAYTVCAFTTFLQSGGIRDILIQRQEKSPQWLVSAFWLSVTIGFAAALLMGAFAYVGAVIYHNPNVIGITWAVGGIAFAGSFGVVPIAILQSQLRFRENAAVALIDTVGTPSLSIALAAMGLGAYSLVLSRLVTAAIQSAAAWQRVGISFWHRPDMQLWRTLLVDTGVLMALALLWNVVLQADRFSLGLFHDARVVGLYFFAFNLSTQIVQLLVVNLVNVLFPALATLNDDQRRIDAVARVVRLLTVVGFPLACLQSATAQPLVAGLFSSQWRDSAGIVAVLSLAMGANLTGMPYQALLRAQGRFRLLLCTVLAYTLAMFAVTLCAARWAGPLAVAWCVLGVSAAFALACACLGARSYRFKAIRSTVGVCVRGWLFGAVVWMVSWSLVSCVSATTRREYLVQLAVAGVAGLLVHLLLVRYAAPGEWRELRQRAIGVLRSRSAVR